ncbi:hypothetical protein F5Y12DRAFT_536540 [Xylaria sp. FL1777]|nr:hypothetical protein F5Y12DRAFT_536540 [Xylaria sp. FL1777]
MARDPMVWVLVRNYRLLKTNSLVQSPNVALEAQGPRVIIREINGEYMEEPRVVDDIKSLGDDINRKAYHHAAHGVYISQETHAGNFPIWVCLERSVNCQEYHLSVLNLYSFEFSVFPISKICWIPSHETADGELYTIISGPGKHGYKETHLPAIVQKLGLPEQAKYAVPLSSLPGLTKLEPRRQQKLFNQQYMNFKQGYRACSRLTRLNLRGLGYQRQSHIGIDSEFPGFCRDDYLYSDEESTSSLPQNPSVDESIPEGLCRCPCRYSDLGPTYLNLNPLHRHVTDSECDLGSDHQPHCIFGVHRLDHCVINGPGLGREHDHCVLSGSHSMIVDPVMVNTEHRATGANTTVNRIAAAELEIEPDGDVETKSLPGELEDLAGQRCFRDSEKLLQDRDMQMWSIHHDTPLSSLESRQSSPAIEFFPDMPEDQERLGNLPDPAPDFTAIQGPIVTDYDALMTTPEPPEIRR